MRDSELVNQCSDLEISLTVEQKSEIDEYEMYEDIKMFINACA